MLDRLARRQVKDRDLVVGVGDDCAIVRTVAHSYQLITTDMLVEDDHFSLKWFSAYQIGQKLVEANVSDIICKGGRPRFAFLSMCLRSDTSYEWLKDFYQGLDDALARHQISLAGGDTTHGAILVFNLTLTGEIEPHLIRLRSQAQVGDLICVTGKLGGSAAGLSLLRAGLEGYLDDYLKPQARTYEEGKLIASYAHATIDVSDGLASEVGHLARESKTGAVIFAEKVPLSWHTIEAGQRLNLDPLDFALYGGEDFQIVFTISPPNLNLLQNKFRDFEVVGEILPLSEGVFLSKNGLREPLKKGYDHFA